MPKSLTANSITPTIATTSTIPNTISSSSGGGMGQNNKINKV